ncbi:MAG: EpsG family protein [Methyloprofundus sp.]|nr:EpsG family protein [Methyloprofundus sp.]
MIRVSGFFVFFISALYSLIISFILPLNGFKDRGNYLIYADKSLEFITGYFDQGVVSFLTNEPVFLSINYFLSLFFSPELTLQLLIFIFSFIFAFAVLSYDKKLFLWLLLLLLLPQVLKNNIMQLRQGYAVAIFTFAWICLHGKPRFFLIALTPLMHSSFFVVLLFLLIYKAAHWIKLNFGLRAFLVGLAALVASVALLYLASVVGARQGARYNDAGLNVSGLAFLFWFMVFSVFLFQSKSWFSKHGFPVATLLVYLVMYFTFPLSARVFESTLPLVMIAGFSMQGWKLYSFKILFLFYFFYQYYLGLQKPFLGFAGSNYTGLW